MANGNTGYFSDNWEQSTCNKCGHIFNWLSIPGFRSHDDSECPECGYNNRGH